MIAVIAFLLVFSVDPRHILSYRCYVNPNANALGRVDQNQDGSLTRVELIKRLRKDEELVSLLNLPKHVGDGDRGAFEAVFQGCVFAKLSISLCTTEHTADRIMCCLGAQHGHQRRPFRGHARVRNVLRPSPCRRRLAEERGGTR